MSVKITYKEYWSDEGGTMHFQKKGSCHAYIPKVATTRADRQPNPHVTLDFNGTVVVLDLAEFKKFCHQVLGTQKRKNNVVKLKSISGGK